MLHVPCLQSNKSLRSSLLESFSGEANNNVEHTHFYPHGTTVLGSSSIGDAFSNDVRRYLRMLKQVELSFDLSVCRCYPTCFRQQLSLLPVTFRMSMLPDLFSSSLSHDFLCFMLHCSNLGRYRLISQALIPKALELLQHLIPIRCQYCCTCFLHHVQPFE